MDHGQAALLFQHEVHGSRLPAENAVNRDAQGGGLAVHRPAAADDEIGDPEKVEPVHGPRRDDRPGAFKPVRESRPEALFLWRVARQEDRPNSRSLTDPRHELVEEDVALGIVIMGLVRRRADGDDHVVVAKAQFLSERRCRLEFRNVDVLLDASVIADVAQSSMANPPAIRPPARSSSGDG